MVVALGFVFVNAVGAWAVSRRKPRVSRVFLLASVVLVVAAVAVGYRLRFATGLLAVGLMLAWLASYMNARLVLGRVVPWHHLLRAVSMAAVVVLTGLALR